MSTLRDDEITTGPDETFESPVTAETAETDSDDADADDSDQGDDSDGTDDADTVDPSVGPADSAG